MIEYVFFNKDRNMLFAQLVQKNVYRTIIFEIIYQTTKYIHTKKI